MKTPAEIAQDAMSAFTLIDHDDYEPGDDLSDADVAEQSWGFIRDQIAEAINADRAQRDLVALVAEALDERAASGADDAEIAARAAQLVRDTDPDDDLRHNYIGPMLDSLQEDYGRLHCDECHADATEFYPKLNPPVQLCDSCHHDAIRSGWEPGR